MLLCSKERGVLSSSRLKASGLQAFRQLDPGGEGVRTALPSLVTWNLALLSVGRMLLSLLEPLITLSTLPFDEEDEEGEKERISNS